MRKTRKVIQSPNQTAANICKNKTHNQIYSESSTTGWENANSIRHKGGGMYGEDILK
jgi:hypothetical protein